MLKHTAGTLCSALFEERYIFYIYSYSHRPGWALCSRWHRRIVEAFGFMLLLKVIVLLANQVKLQRNKFHLYCFQGMQELRGRSVPNKFLIQIRPLALACETLS